MKKRKLFNTLAKKYDLPIKYVSFKSDSFYIYKASVELSEKECIDFENCINWEYMKQDFDRDRNCYSSIFYGM
jgi:hypothetical protein